MNIFETAARKKFRYRAPQGLLTTEQLYELPLTSATGKANLNDVAVAVDEEREKLGKKSFVDAGSNPRAAELDTMLEVVKHVIATRQQENAAVLARAVKREKRDKILDAMATAESRELGSKSMDELRKELAALAALDD